MAQSWICCGNCGAPLAPEASPPAIGQTIECGGCNLEYMRSMNPDPASADTLWYSRKQRDARRLTREDHAWKPAAIVAQMIEDPAAADMPAPTSRDPLPSISIATAIEILQGMGDAFELDPAHEAAIAIAVTHLESANLAITIAALADLAADRLEESGAEGNAILIRAIRSSIASYRAALELDREASR